VLRALRPWLEQSLRRRRLRRLRACARATNAARDAEVQLAWLESKRDLLGARRLVAGLDDLVGRIGAAGDEEPLEPQRVVGRFLRVARKLERELGRYVREVDQSGASARVSFAGALATTLGHQNDLLRERVGEIAGANDVSGIHAARIEAKRLRYLLEPLRDTRHAGARDVVNGLKRLQDVLGELHDVHVLAQRVEEALVRAAGERARRVHRAIYGGGELVEELRDPGPRPGLLAVARLAAQRRDALFAGLEHEWRHGALEALAGDVAALERELEARAGGKVERERKYLLTAVPPRALQVEPIDIEQGWLPGARLRERIRRMRGPDGERFVRALKQGSGLARLEAEEEATREVFDALWPLTAGRRIAKRRRKVEEGGLVWEIDEFTDRELVLAEVELPAGGSPRLPEWLAPLVRREVTDDPAYANENLAAGEAAPAADRSGQSASKRPGVDPGLAQP
jgi:CYTH domain-containing protein